LNGIAFRKMKYLLIGLIFLLACTVKKAQVEVVVPSKDKIVFLVFNASRDVSLANTKVELIKKTESTGKIKQSKKQKEISDNYLRFDFFQDGYFYDSVKIAHPLFKHFEYIDERNQFVVKDTMVLNSEFFHRFQLNNGKYIFNIYEVVKNRSPYLIKSFEL